MIVEKKYWWSLGVFQGVVATGMLANGSVSSLVSSIALFSSMYILLIKHFTNLENIKESKIQNLALGLMKWKRRMYVQAWH